MLDKPRGESRQVLLQVLHEITHQILGQELHEELHEVLQRFFRGSSPDDSAKIHAEGRDTGRIRSVPAFWFI